ncbi:MAG: M48 family metallopeptidase [Bernardetiaceae bacterium]|nr:M48 family metallopeptidase [Bernardetiaceae bacterium]
MSQIFKLTTLSIMLWFLAACSTVPVSGRKQLAFIPNSELFAMSYQQYSGFLDDSRVVTGTPEAKMVANAGSRIKLAVEEYMREIGASDRTKDFRWEFNLVEGQQVNAWCMPGGKVVFYTGIMPVCQDELGVAVVMGHEIAHAIADHGNERMSQGMLAQGLGTGLSVALSQKPNLTNQLFLQAFGISSQLGTLAFSRRHESEADKLGLYFMALAGYNPEEAPRFWQRMEARSSGGGPPEFLSTHPSSSRRIKDLNSHMPKAKAYYQRALNR